MERMREYFTAMLRGETKPREGHTHLMEIVSFAKEGLGDLSQTKEIHYMSDGICCEIKFADGKTYTIEVREKRS